MIKQLFLTLTITALVSTAPIQANCSLELANQIVDIMYTQVTKGFTVSHKLVTEQFKNMPFADAINQDDISEFNTTLESAMITLMANKKASIADVISQKFTDDQEALKYLELVKDPVMQKFNEISLELATVMIPSQAEMLELQDTIGAAAQKNENKINTAKSVAAAQTDCNNNECNLATCTTTTENN